MQEVKAVFIHQQLVTAAESVYFDGQVERGTRQFQFAFFDPMIAFMGVRMSWLIAERKSVLARLAS